MNAADQLLLSQIRQGDQVAWEQFIARFEGRLLAFVNSRLSNRSLSEDVVQEAFIGFLTSLPNYDQSTPIESFLFSIAAHKLTDQLRKQGRRPAVPLFSGVSDGPTPEPVGVARKASSMMRSREGHVAEQRIVNDCLSNLIEQWLREQQFERLKCAELLFVLGRPNKDVAAELNISEKDVANHKFFIVSKLKEAAARAQLKDTSIPELRSIAATAD